MIGADAGAYEACTGETRNIVRVGSCASLVGEHVLAIADVPPSIAKMLLSAILVDTADLLPEAGKVLSSLQVLLLSNLNGL